MTYLTTKKFWIAAFDRAVRTFAQGAIGAIGGAAIISEVNWITVLSTAALATLVSLLTSIITGLPEAEPAGDNKNV